MIMTVQSRRGYGFDRVSGILSHSRKGCRFCYMIWFNVGEKINIYFSVSQFTRLFHNG